MTATVKEEGGCYVTVTVKGGRMTLHGGNTEGGRMTLHGGNTEGGRMMPVSYTHLTLPTKVNV